MVQLCETGFCQFPQIRPRDWPDTKENFLLVESSIKKWSFSFLYKGKIRVCSEIKKEKTQRQQVEGERERRAMKGILIFLAGFFHMNACGDSIKRVLKGKQIINQFWSKLKFREPSQPL